MQWYYSKQGKQFGPVNRAELSRLVQKGEIREHDLVWNSSLGDNWVQASTIDGLFAQSPHLNNIPQLPVTYSKNYDTENQELMRMARESLRGHWGLGVGVILLQGIIFWGLDKIHPIISIILAGPLFFGVCLVFLSLSRRKESNIAQLFAGFNRFGTTFGTYFLGGLFIFLWSLLFIIPGIIASYAYSMAFYIIADDPSITPLEAISKSKNMMRGRKWKLFCLYLRFIGWGILSILTLGIGFLWLSPYIYTSIAHFYDDIKDRPAP
jgi:uncharacterized membrane protein